MDWKALQLRQIFQPFQQSGPVHVQIFDQGLNAIVVFKSPNFAINAISQLNGSIYHFTYSYIVKIIIIVSYNNNIIII